METPLDCTVPLPRQRRTGPGNPRFGWLWLLLLAAAVLVMHGYHPWAEDGGLYVAGVEYTLHPTLFPHDTAFVTEHLRFSIFAPVIAGLVRSTHAPLADVLLSVYFISALLTLVAVHQIARLCLREISGQWIATALFAAAWTLPVAGTSLLLMDPYVTARSLSTPLSLLAIAAALRPWTGRESPICAGSRSVPQRAAALCLLCLVIAAAFHPLMAAYAFAFVILLRFLRQRRAPLAWCALVALPFLVAAGLQARAQPETPPAVAAAYSRFYWFLSQWQWFEWLGVLSPLLIFWALARWARTCLTGAGVRLSRACLVLGLLALGIAIAFAREHLRAYPVARLQPLRCFLPIYAVMIPLLGGAFTAAARRHSARLRRSRRSKLLAAVPMIVLPCVAVIMFSVQRATFPRSPHIEWPGRANPNPWVKAFVWSREHTANTALFALDARYVNTHGEDAQTFRAIAERSAIPDFSKDGGEAAITPSLASAWQRSAEATRGLSQLPDSARDARLRPFGVSWVVLGADAGTTHPCPYRNAVVKVCRLQ